MDKDLNACPLCSNEAEFVITAQEKCFCCAKCGSFRLALEAEAKLRHLMVGVRRIWSQMARAAPPNHCLAIGIADGADGADGAGARRSIFGLDARYRTLNANSGYDDAAAMPVTRARNPEWRPRPAAGRR